MAELIALCANLVLGIVIPSQIILYDLKRLSPQAQEKAWNDASLWSAVIGFGPLAVCVHFARTRGFWPGLPLGLLLAGLCTAILAGLGWSADALLGPG